MNLKFYSVETWKGKYSFAADDIRSVRRLLGSNEDIRSFASSIDAAVVTLHEVGELEVINSENYDTFFYARQQGNPLSNGTYILGPTAEQLERI